MTGQPKTTIRRLPPQETVRLGRDIYERKIREQVYPAQRGKTVAIDVESGDWTIANNHAEATKRLKSLRGDAYVAGNVYVPQVNHEKPKSPTKSFEQIFYYGEKIYERDIRARIEPEHNGRFVAIDIDSGEWALAADYLIAGDRLRDLRPEALNILYVTVGYRDTREVVSESPSRLE